MSKSRGVSGPHMLLKIIGDSKIPLEEEEARLHSIKGKVERDAQLSRDDEAFFARLVERANEWQMGTRSPDDTETRHNVRMRVQSWRTKK